MLKVFVVVASLLVTACASEHWVRVKIVDLAKPLELPSGSRINRLYEARGAKGSDSTALFLSKIIKESCTQNDEALYCPSVLNNDSLPKAFAGDFNERTKAVSETVASANTIIEAFVALPATITSGYYSDKSLICFAIKSSKPTDPPCSPDSPDTIPAP